MKVDLEFVELHSPLFMSDHKQLGKNFGTKIDHKKHPGMTLVYDRVEKELLVSHGGREAIIPLTNVVSMTPSILKVLPLEQPKVADPELARPRATAQVSTPTSHVFAGKGHGETGQEKPKGKAII